MTQRLTPPRPFGCRGPLPGFDKMLQPYYDELEVRQSFRTSMDEQLSGVLALGDRRFIRPSTRLYGGQVTQRDHEWLVEWATARAVEISALPVSVILNALGGPLMCRGSNVAAQLFAKAIGNLVHRKIMSRYRSRYATHTVACDNRVFFPVGGSQRLAQLTRTDPTYDALNYCLAGQRCDIIDVDLREMWEIKPASLSSSATLQLWGYLDNYEIARGLARYRRERIPPPITRGNPSRLDKRVVAKFDIELNPVMGLALEVTPTAIKELPGLILYTVALKNTRNRGRQRAQANVALNDGDITMQQLLLAARREAQLVYDKAAADARRDAQTFCAVTAIAAAAALLIASAGLLAPEEGVLVAEGADVAGAAAFDQAAVGGAEVVNLADYRAAAKLLPELTKIAASVASVYLGERTFQLPPEIVGTAIHSGSLAGSSLGPSSL